MISNSFQENYNLQIKLKTWTRKTKNMYDFKATSEEYEFSNLLINETGYVCRSGNKINFLNIGLKNNSILKDLKLITRARCFKNQTQSLKKTWRVIGNGISKNDVFKSNYVHEMKVNDVIKLGILMFEVKDVNIMINQNNISENTKEIEIKINKMGSDICKFCLQNNDELENPFINLCRCKGTLNLVHLNCLKTWLDHNLIKKSFPQKHLTIYFIKAYCCEICKDPFPIHIKFGNKTQYLINLDPPLNKDYILMQKINLLEDISLTLILFSFNESVTEYLIGRNKSNDLSLLDSTISNIHCKLTLNNGKIYLNDCDSKFGTMVLSKEQQIEVLPKQKLIMQVGRTLLSCSLIPRKRTCSHFLNFYRNKNKKAVLSMDSNFFKAFKTADVTNVYFKSQLALLQKEEFNDENNQDFEEDKLI